MKMHSLLRLSCLLALTTSCLSMPLSVNPSNEAIHKLRRQAECGLAGDFFNQKASDWNNNGLDAWLDAWMISHTTDIEANPYGFVGAFGRWAIGNPNWSCRDEGSEDDCDFNPCGNAVLNGKRNETRQAYYVMESVNRLHTYFNGLNQAFSSASIVAALTKDSWATTFYKDKDVKSVTALREVLNAVTAVVGAGAAFAGLGGPITGTVAGAGAALFAGATGAISPLLGQHQDNTFQTSADLGGLLGSIVLKGMKTYTNANNLLMRGENFQDTGDIRTYLKGGLFLDFPGIDKVAVIDNINAKLIGHAVNALWRNQKVFIIGGGACGDGQGIGEGPQDMAVCRDGKAWYLYWWEEPGGLVLNKHKYGWTQKPLGWDKLGKGDYAGVTIADVINSSLDSYAAARYAYGPETAVARAQDALQNGWGNPGAAGASWEGTFTIPVCDVGWAVTGDIPDKKYILQPTGKDYRPHWCGPICSGDVQQTRNWIGATNMANFQSPRFACPNEPPY